MAPFLDAQDRVFAQNGADPGALAGTCRKALPVVHPGQGGRYGKEPWAKFGHMGAQLLEKPVFEGAAPLSGLHDIVFQGLEFFCREAFCVGKGLPALEVRWQLPTRLEP